MLRLCAWIDENNQLVALTESGKYGYNGRGNAIKALGQFIFNKCSTYRYYDNELYHYYNYNGRAFETKEDLIKALPYKLIEFEAIGEVEYG